MDHRRDIRRNSGAESPPRTRSGRGRNGSRRARHPRARPLLPVAAAAAAALLAAAALVGRSAVTTPSPAAARLGVGPHALSWAPRHGSLATRVASLALPPESDTGFHIHVWLHVFVDGRPVPVPAGIGIDPAGGFIAPLHTHDDSGIVHVESARPYPFTLGQLFAVWGVPFTRSALDGHPDPSVWVDGRRVPDGPRYVLRAHAGVVVAVGGHGSFPTTVPVRFPPGL